MCLLISANPDTLLTTSTCGKRGRRAIDHAALVVEPDGPVSCAVAGAVEDVIPQARLRTEASDLLFVHGRRSAFDFDPDIKAWEVKIGEVGTAIGQKKPFRLVVIGPAHRIKKDCPPGLNP